MSYDVEAQSTRPPQTHHGITVREVGERALIARITARLPTQAGVVIGPGDDAAVIEPQRQMLDVLTTDALVEGVHFDRRFCPLDAVGHKALAVNLSDLAAMGAAPRAALLSLVLPDDLPVSDIDALVDGILPLAERTRIAVIGGNIARSAAPRAFGSAGPLVVDVTALGAVARRRVLTRSGARPGDEVYVTGSIGAGGVGLRVLQASPAGATEASVATSELGVDSCTTRYLRPEPRTRAGMLLGRNRAASSCIDTSDGLGAAVRQLAAASDVGFIIEAEALPIDAAAKRWYERHGGDAVRAALASGDDYELLFTVRPSQRGRLQGVRRQLGGLRLTRVGVATKARAIVLRTPAGDSELPVGFEHFR